MRLLLIEDESSSVELAKKLLGPFASRIDPASSLKDGLYLARTNDYDVVILDLSLPDSGRLETIDRISELRRTAKAPVVVITGWPDPDIKEQCLQAGADAFVNKNELTGAALMAVQVALQHAPDKVREPTFTEHVEMLQRILHSA